MNSDEDDDDDECFYIGRACLTLAVCVFTLMVAGQMVLPPPLFWPNDRSYIVFFGLFLLALCFAIGGLRLISPLRTASPHARGSDRRGTAIFV